MAYQFNYNELTFCEDVMRYATLYYRKNERHYHDKYTGGDLVEKAKLHAIYHYTLDLFGQSKKERGCFKKDIHRQLCLLKINIPKNYDYFCSVLKEMRDKNIHSILEHESKGEPRYKSRKFDPILIEHAETIYSKGLTTHKQIYEKVKRKAESLGLLELSVDTIKKHFAKPDVQARLRPLRNGPEWYESNTAKQLHFSKPEYAGQLLEIDGTRLQIPFNNTELKKIDFLTVFVILDVTSSKILGYAHGLFESSKVVRNAFRRFFENNKFLPLQITRDGGSGYKKDFKFIEELTSKRGVDWVVTHNPKGKPHVENFNKTFAKSICSHHDYYIGLGITSSHIDSRITSKAKLKKRIGARKNLGTYEELVLDIDFLMNEYNHTAFNFSESSNDKFDRLFDPNEVIELLDPDKTAMTCVFKAESIRNSEFDIVVDGKRNFYQIPGDEGEGEILAKVNVAFDPENLELVHVYDDNHDFCYSLPLTEVIPALASQRTSSQQNKYIRELAARKNRFKRLEQDIHDKNQRVAEASSNSLSFEILKIHTNKEDEIEAQNEFTRALISEESSQTEERIKHSLPNSYIAPVDQSQFKRLAKWK